MEEAIEKWLLSDDGIADEYYESYTNAPDKAKWWIEHRSTFRNYPGYRQVNNKVSLAPLKDRLKKEMGDENWDESTYEEKQDIASDLGTTVEKLDEAWTDYKDEKAKSDAIQARTEEVKNWPWYKKMVASDYAKQRYINEPEKSIFSDEGEWFNKGEDVSDLLYGGAATVADMIPVGVPGARIPKVGQTGVSIGLGPAVRALRDIQHKRTGSKYQKDWDEIGEDALADLGINAAVHGFANFRRGKRGAENLASETKVDDAIKLENRAEANQLAESQFYRDNMVNLERNQQELSKQIKSLPESDFKKELTDIANKPDYKPDDLRGFLDEWTDFKQGNKSIYYYDDASDLIKQTNVGDTKLGQNAFDFYKEIANRESLEGFDKAAAKVTKGVQNALRNDNLTNAAMKVGADAGLSIAGIRPRSIHKPQELEQAKHDRWSKGYASWDEKKTPEYKEWEENNLKAILGLEE